MEKTNGIKRYRHFRGYDYTRGARLFLTTSLAPPHPALGRVEWLADGQPSGGRLDGGASARQARVVLTPAGEAVETALVETPRFVPAVSLERHVVMPDHVHLLVNLRPGEAQPLKTLGRFMSGFKRVAAKNAGICWEQGYHDRICLGAEFRRHVEDYIAQNPLKWALMHEGSGGPTARHQEGGAVCRVREPLESPVLDEADYWRGLGSLDLLEAKLCAVRISRRVERLPEALAARFLRGAAAGWVFLSTFLSAGERELFALLAANGGRMVVVKERGLEWVYRPDIHEAPLLAEGRLAVLGLGGFGRPTAGLQEVTRMGSLLLNDKIAAMAAASGGLALRIGEEGLELRRKDS
jgi:REP element-mobilizing transposase RayT